MLHLVANIQYSLLCSHYQDKNHTALARAMSGSSLTISRALQIARDNGEVPNNVLQYLNRKYNEVWTKIQQNPSSYVMTQDEYSVLNYFKTHESDSRYKNAVSRFWNYFNGHPAQIDGATASSASSRH